MDWKRKAGKAAIHYERLSKSNCKCGEERAPKGYVPMLVGLDSEAAERILVRVSLLKDPCICELLKMAAEEFGYRQQGVLRIPCDLEHFRRIVDETGYN